MKNLIFSLGLISAFFSIYPTGSSASEINGVNPVELCGCESNILPLVTIMNITDKTVSGTVEYSTFFCRNDRFTIPPNSTWTAPSRGACLLTSISAKIDGRDCIPYRSIGTTFSTFAVVPQCPGFQICRTDGSSFVDVQNPSAACGFHTWFEDKDGDGFGRGSAIVTRKSIMPGFATRGGDCNDLNPAVNPDAKEVSSNDLDDDCNKATPDCTGRGLLPIQIDPDLRTGSGDEFTVLFSKGIAVMKLPWGTKDVDMIRVPNSSDGNDKDGRSNTEEIVLQLGAADNFAAGFCKGVVDQTSGCADWYLPAISELSSILRKLGPAGENFLPAGTYWSSTEFNASHAWSIQLGDAPNSNFLTPAVKTQSNFVICVKK